MSEVTTLRGVIRGQTVVLDRPVDFSEGETVKVMLSKSSAIDEELPQGEGLKRSAGAWASEDEQMEALPGFGALADQPEEVDDFNRWNRVQRRRGFPL